MRSLCRKGCANTFTYQCGLKQHTGQAYVHVTEDNGGDNVSFMGLILHKYVQNVAALRQDTWQGTLPTFVQMLPYQYVVGSFLQDNETVTCPTQALCPMRTILESSLTTTSCNRC